ncbi:MAG: peptidyl-tRNA hydrolase [Candidatus Woesearchaeota archaeon]|nr:MAG: peptidyl-tRNA hydrolase [Candidatus Woesearchaeota archaeon]
MKQVILVRQDLKLSRGKASAQVAHASLESAMKSDKETVSEWRNEGAKKVILKVKDEKELLDFQKKAKQVKLTTSLITDAGKTHLDPGTITCLAIGPDKEEKIDKITGHLKLIN